MTNDDITELPRTISAKKNENSSFSMRLSDGSFSFGKRKSDTSDKGAPTPRSSATIENTDAESYRDSMDAPRHLSFFQRTKLLLHRSNTAVGPSDDISKASDSITNVSIANSDFSLKRTISLAGLNTINANHVRQNKRKNELVNAVLQEPTLLDKALNTRLFQGITFFATIWILFAEDFKVIAAPIRSDLFFDIMTVSIFILFVCELLLVSVSSQKKSYFLKFFFWLDLIAALSLIPELLAVFDIHILGGQFSSLAFARAGRAARASARLGRIARMARVFRFFKQRSQKDTPFGTSSQGDDDDILKPTLVGTRLRNLITEKVVLAVLVMMLAFTLLDADSSSINSVRLEGLESLSEMNMTQLEAGLEVFKRSLGLPLYLKLPGYTEFSMPVDELTKRFRHSEMVTLSYDFILLNGTEFESLAYFDNRETVKVAAGYNIGLTLFVLILLSVGNYLIQRDIVRLVIRPIEHMTTLITDLSNNPFMDVNKANYMSAGQQNETNVLLNMITRFSVLLQLGFGQAGKEIIMENMASVDSKGGLRCLIPGNKIDAIFGFCDIRRFTDVTDVLKEDVMVFVNQIAQIVHETVYDHSGHPNKNIGDAFLLVWKYAEDMDFLNDESLVQPLEVEDPKNYMLANRNRKGSTLDFGLGMHGLSSMALASQSQKVLLGPNSFLSEDNLHKSAESIEEKDQAQQDPDPSTSNVPRESQELHALRMLAVEAFYSFLKISERLQSDEMEDMVNKIAESMPGYELHMGFGYHVGWAIEGPIGSRYKIDASYLSPHVNLASRLESGSKMFGVSNLFSGQFYYLLPPQFQSFFIKMDRVKLKGSHTPMVLYTVNPMLRMESTGDFGRESIEDISPEAEVFRDDYERAVNLYLNGHWVKSRNLFTNILENKPCPLEMGGTALLNYMSEFNFNAPSDWKGCRSMTDK